MKTLFLFSILLITGFFSFPSIAQCDFIRNDIDEFTKDITKITSEKEIGKGASGNILYCSLARIGNTKTIHLHYSIAQLGCATSKSYAIILFEDGSTIKFYHKGEIDCDDSPTFYSLMTEDAIKQLRIKKVDKIRYSLSKYSSDIKVLEHDYFVQTIKCLE